MIKLAYNKELNSLEVVEELLNDCLEAVFEVDHRVLDLLFLAIELRGNLNLLALFVIGHSVVLF